VTVHVRRLREKLEDDASKPQLLETVWGAGYRLRA
jgi:DNA-binding response OmpR family regulator